MLFLLRTNLNVLRNATSFRYFCSAQIPRNVIEGVISAHNQTENGVVYDKKPFKLHLEEKKSFSWCLCGKSKSQPLCDGK